MSSTVESLGTFRLVLNSSSHLNLKNSFYVPSFFRNLVSILRLAHLNFKFEFENRGFSLFHNLNIVGHYVLVNNLYKFDLDHTCECNLSELHGDGIWIIFKLWYKRLGRIPIK